MGVTPPDQIADAASGGRFVTGEEKQAMFNAKEPFYIAGAEPQVPTRFEKDQTYFYIVRKLADGTREQRILPLTHSPYRQRLAEKVVDDTKQGNVSGPWYLEKFRTAGGQDAWNLATKPPETAADAPSLETPWPDAQVGTTATTSSDEIATPNAAPVAYEDLPF